MTIPTSKTYAFCLPSVMSADAILEVLSRGEHTKNCSVMRYPENPNDTDTRHHVVIEPLTKQAIEDLKESLSRGVFVHFIEYQTLPVETSLM